MGGAPYEYCVDPNFPSSPVELLVAAGDGAFEH